MFIVQEVKVKERVKEVKPNEYSVSEILSAYSRVEKQIKLLYEKVFNKTENFKPTFPQTVADTFNYLYSILKAKGYSAGFEKAFGLANIVPKAFEDNYIPYSIKLSKWAEDKGLIVIVEPLLSEITSLYYESVKAVGAELTEEELTNNFSVIINYAL